MAGMANRLWIVGLFFALCFYAGLTVVIVAELFRYHHLYVRAWIMLAANSYVAWITYRYLRRRIAAEKQQPSR